jgi:nitrogen fixation protein FixH
MTQRQLTGRHVLAIFGGGFAVVIAANLALAVSAVRTFPGLEVANSYVASQVFDAERTAQEALGWDVDAEVRGGELHLTILHDGTPVRAQIDRATFGRATVTAADQEPALRWDGTGFHGPVEAGPGNWNLRLEARAADGTLFRQRLVVRVAR